MQKDILLALLLLNLGFVPAAAAELDLNFQPGGGANGPVNAVAVQKDGRILLAGDFTSLSGHERLRIARIHPDGTLDPSFDPGAGPDAPLSAVAVQEDGKIVVAGTFTTFNLIRRVSMARLRADGRLDESFEPGSGTTLVIWDPPLPIGKVAVQPGGEIIVSGGFRAFNGVVRNGIARLDPNGELDQSFDPPRQYHDIESGIHDFIVQAGGKIVVGGAFPGYDDYQRSAAARLLPDGSVDPDFDLGLPLGTPRDPTRIYAIAQENDGRFLIAGKFPSAQGERVENIARFDADGALDLSFTPPGMGMVSKAVLQPGGRVIVLKQSLGKPDEILRLNRDGSFDPGFKALVTGSVQDLQVEANGDLLVAGNFTAINSMPVVNSARLFSGLPPPTFQPEPPHQVIRAGQTIVLHFEADLNAPVQFQWRANGDELPGQTNALLQIFNARSSHAGRYEVEIKGAHGTLLSEPSLVQVNEQAPKPGRPDLSFHPGPASGRPAVKGVTTASLQPDGKLLIGGSFDRIQGVPRKQLARLHQDGSLDLSFDPPLLVDCCSFTESHEVENIAITPNGKIMIAGSITESNPPGSLPSAKFYLGRLHLDGSRDTGFPVASQLKESSDVYDKRSLLVEEPGDQWLLLVTIRLLIRASHAAFRFDSNGTPLSAPDWDWQSQPDEDIHAAKFTADGKLLMAGAFTAVEGASHKGMVLLGPGWTPDPSFSVNEGPSGPQLPAVFAFELLQNGQILTGGHFDQFDGEPVSNLARLHPDGRLDLDFHTAKINGPVTGLAAQSDGRIVIAGHFSEVDGVPRPRLARLNNDGSLDLSFDPGAGVPPSQTAPPETWWRQEISVLLANQEEKIIIVGDFGLVDEIPRPGVARLFGHLDRILDGRFEAAAFSITLPTRIGKRYVLQSTDALHQDEWKNVPGAAVDGDGTTMRLPDVSPSYYSRFYRVLIE